MTARPFALGALLALLAAPCPAAEPPARSDQYGDPLPPGAVARMGTVRLRHPGSVLGLAFSPDGQFLVTAGLRETIRFWDVPSGRQRGTLPAGRRRAVFSPDGKLLAVPSGPTGLVVWDLARRSKRHEWPSAPNQRGSDEEVASAFSPDGRLLARAGGRDGTFRLYDLVAGRELCRIPADQWPVGDLCFTADGRGLFSAPGQRHPARLWGVSTGKELRRLGEPAGTGHLALSPDGRTLAVARNGGATLTLWEVATGRELRRLCQRPEDGIEVTILELPGPAFSPDGRLLAEPGPRGDVLHLWEVGTGRLARTWKAPDRLGALAFSPDGKLLAGGDRYRDAVHLWDVATGRELTPERGHASELRALAVSRDGRHVASLDAANSVRLWDAATDRQLRVWDSVGYPPALAFSPDGRALAFSNPKGHLCLWDVGTGRLLRRMRHGGGCDWAAFTPDGQSVVGCQFPRGDSVPDTDIYVWEAATGRRLREARIGPEDTITCVALAPDGRTLFVQPGLWDLATCRPRLPLSRVTAFAAAFSADGRLLVTSGEDHHVHLWELASGQERAALPGHKTGSWAVALSPDGRLLASGDGRDNAVRLRDLATGRELPALAGHAADASGLLFSADGTRLFSASDDTTVLAWDMTGRLPPLDGPAPDHRRLEALWADLAGTDAARAGRAVWALAAAPRQAVPFLEQNLRPAALDPALERRARELLAQLDADDFKARERAVAALQKMGDTVSPFLRGALPGRPSAEARQRLERLVAGLGSAGLSADELRAVRAVEALEHAGRPEARRLVEKLAGGAPEARLTQEAKVSLRRWRPGRGPARP
jgi:WD40 repeat protein